MGTGWSARLAMFGADAERKLLEPLRHQGWTASIVRQVEHRDHIVMEASRGGRRRTSLRS